jgi:restriction system protein
MNSLDAVEIILKESGAPLHYGEITRRILARALWETEGQTPEATINARITGEMKQHGDRSRFMRVGAGLYALRAWGLPQAPASTAKAAPKAPAAAKRSFTDAAEWVLENNPEKRPMHYRDITGAILSRDLVNTEGQTPEATLYALIITEIKRAAGRGSQSRFVKYGKGLFGLRKWMGEGLVLQIEQHNREVKKKLLKHLLSLTPQGFEQLIGRLLGEMGFESIEVTRFGGDGGIDVRGTLVVGGVIRTRMAVQAKKWKQNVPAPVVQQVRGSLGAHEQGMIITTSGFSKGAQDEAARPDAVPVALVDGQQLAELLIEHQVLIKSEPYQLIYLDLDEASSGF